MFSFKRGVVSPISSGAVPGSIFLLTLVVAILCGLWLITDCQSLRSSPCWGLVLRMSEFHLKSR